MYYLYVHKVSALCPVLNAYEEECVDKNRKLQQKSSGSSREVITRLNFILKVFIAYI
jgi:hypothetical protein